MKSVLRLGDQAELLAESLKKSAEGRLKLKEEKVNQNQTGFVSGEHFLPLAAATTTTKKPHPFCLSLRFWCRVDTGSIHFHLAVPWALQTSPPAFLRFGRAKSLYSSPWRWLWTSVKCQGCVNIKLYNYHSKEFENEHTKNTSVVPLAKMKRNKLYRRLTLHFPISH